MIILSTRLARVRARTVGAGLLRDQTRAKQRLHALFQGLLALDDLHPAGLAAPAGMHLGLHDPAVSAHRFGGLQGLVDGTGWFSLWRGNAIVGEQRLGLVFMQVHGDACYCCGGLLLAPLRRVAWRIINRFGASPR